MKQQRNKRRWVVVRLTVGLLWLALGADYVAAETFSGSAPVNRITARMTDDRVCRTLATTLEQIPGTKVQFTQGGATPQEVVVTFVADWPRPRDDEIPFGSQRAGAFIFLFIDGDRVDFLSEGGGVLVHEGTASSVSNGTHGFTFVTEPIPPGDHEARIHFLDNVLGPFGDPNGTVCVGDRSTVVQHRK
ncbi:MAG: hypothetical protein ACREV4_01325 [Gammaproteobacteria bacterium]